MKVWVTPIVHPSSCLRGRWHLEPCQETYLRRLSTLLREGRTPEPVPWDRPPTGAILRPTLSQLAEWRQGVTDAVSVDIENAGDFLLCVGLTQLDLSTGTVGRTVCLPFRVRGGDTYWRTRAELVEAVGWLNEVLGSRTVAKVFHFGVMHDVPILRRMGFDVEGRLVDTANLAHCAFSELPKGLQFLSTLYCGAPVWKRLTDETDDEEGKT